MPTTFQPLYVLNKDLYVLNDISQYKNNLLYIFHFSYILNHSPCTNIMYITLYVCVCIYIRARVCVCVCVIISMLLLFML